MAKADTARWQRRKGDRPAEILASAQACFAEHGYAATRLEAVAKRAGVTKGTIYHYFADKEALFKAVVHEAFAPHLNRFEAMANSSEKTSTLLAALAASWVEGLSAPSSAIIKLVLSEAGNFPEVAKTYVADVVARDRASVEAILRRGIVRGELREMNVERVSFALTAQHMFAALWMHALAPYDDRPFDGPSTLSDCLAMFLGCVGAGAPPGSMRGESPRAIPESDGSAPASSCRMDARA